MTAMNALATCFRAILAAISPRAAAERARAAALLLFWNHIEQSLHQLDHLLTLWRTNSLPGASAMRSSPQCEPTAPPAATPAPTRSRHPRQPNLIPHRRHNRMRPIPHRSPQSHPHSPPPRPNPNFYPPMFSKSR